MAPNRKPASREAAGRKQSNRETPPGKTKATLRAIGKPSPADDPTPTNVIVQMSIGGPHREVTSQIAILGHRRQTPRPAQKSIPTSQTLSRRSPYLSPRNELPTHHMLETHIGNGSGSGAIFTPSQNRYPRQEVIPIAKAKSLRSRLPDGS